MSAQEREVTVCQAVSARQTMVMDQKMMRRNCSVMVVSVDVAVQDLDMVGIDYH